MSIHIFKNKEEEYQRWIAKNSDGFVLTTTKNIKNDYMILHRSSCNKISQYNKNWAQDAFTGRKFIKICSNDPDELIAWIKEQGGKGFTKLCSRCSPDIHQKSIKSLEDYYTDLSKKVSESLKNRDLRKNRLENNENEFPETIEISAKVFRRNPDVIAEVLERANGYCESCKDYAPFKRARDKSPFIEVHHRTPLSRGGKDTVANAIALCPNCHRKMHYG